jgi:hypothetical protein
MEAFPATSSNINLKFYAAFKKGDVFTIRRRVNN